jgi:hypothetical protein
LVERRSDDDGQSPKGDQRAAGDAARAPNLLAERDFASDVAPALSTQLGQQLVVEHKKTSGRCGGFTTEPVSGAA